MSMIEWAKEEIRIACEGERKASGADDGCWDYGCACYESALKAFESLCSDGHSGFSIGMTKYILNRLIEGKVLTPIEDTEDVWSKRVDRHENVTSFQCKRMPSIFKDVYDDGTIKYHDIDRTVCIDIHERSNCWYDGFVSKIYHEMFPITMPYMPETERAKIYCEEFLVDKNNGDFDTLGVLYAVDPNGDKINVGRYFKEGDKGWDEIDIEEYNARKTACGGGRP